MTHAYSTAGDKSVRMRVSDGAEEDSIVKTVTVVAPNAQPVAQFGFSPVSPVVGQEVFFQSFSYDPDGTVITHEWDFDDGPGPPPPDYDDGDANEADAFGTFTFSTPGDHLVRLRVTDHDGATHVLTRTVTVGPAPLPTANQLPVALFAIAPLEPNVGEQVSLRSFSYDPDGSVASQEWDLDGDGDFDENVTGQAAFTTFATAGERILRLRVRDSAGATQTETQTITVRAQVSPTSPPAGQSLMTPFPVIRLAGGVVSRGARVRTLEVRAPSGARITVRCSGRSCPPSTSPSGRGRPVRFRRLARFLRAGTVIAVGVRKGDTIGKHTRWLIRAGKLPRRKDSCLYPGISKPRRCPSS